jgi:CubicO group peptidase (beta-lactamase class C family)
VLSVLVVRHGYLVYERYWHGVDAGDGQSSFSVTKSFISALVGIALGDGKLKGLDQTVEELLAPHLPPDADPRLRRVTVAQLLAMTSGLAGDDSSLGGDDRIWDRVFQSRDWVRHILGRRPETTPGTEFAYSGANSHLLSAIVADTTGQSTLAYARAKLFGPLGIDADHALEQVLRRWPPTQAQVAAYERRRWPGPGTPRATTWATACCGCPPATWPSSDTCTSTVGVGTAPRWSRPTTWPPPPGRRATRRWVPGTTATTGG